ncbi:MAG: sugar phosphate isomerase/epimerase [Candidatus Omnitrophica bacterium]|nr:sugar phosphate isomerase/epimerase [Candidatus Omnitrophota bacterium]
MKISVYSLSASDKKVWEVIELAKKYNCDGIEWWCRENAHIDLTNLKKSAGEAAKLMEGSGLICAGLAPYFKFNETKDYLAKIFEAANILKTRNVRCHSHYFDGSIPFEHLMKEQRKWLEEIVLPEAERFDVRLNIEQHHTNICCTPNACRQLVDGLPEKHIGIIFDPGNSAVEGFTRPEYSISVFGKYLAHVHVKNCRQVNISEGAVSGRRYKMEFGSLAEGDLDWFAIIKALKNANFDGFISLEALDKRPTEQKFEQDIVFLQDALKQI